jgi:hypothetical protein
MTYEPDPGQEEIIRRNRLSAQRLFLDQHADLMAPLAYPQPERVRRSFARLLRSWGECSVRLDNERRGITAPTR